MEPVHSRGAGAGCARVDVSREIERRLIAAGRPDFIDKLGRHWPLDQYAETVARTTTREAMIQGTIQRLREHGIELAQVSTHNAADFCVYYENPIVCISDERHPVYPLISAIGGGPPVPPALRTRPDVVRGAPGDRGEEEGGNGSAGDAESVAGRVAAEV